MKKYIKVVIGFRQDQYHTIDAEEAHKAYYLFLNPEMRGVFNNGVALVGKDIRSIEPDYNATMGYNPTHYLEAEDWNDIREKRVDTEIRNTLEYAQLIAKNNPELIALPLSEAFEKVSLPSPSKRELRSGLTSIGEAMVDYKASGK